MKKVVFIFMLALGFAWNCHAQTWTYVQDSLITFCQPHAPTNSCTITPGNIAPTTAGTVWAFLVTTTNDVTISSITGGGGNWQLCPASSCHLFKGSAPAGNVDFAYNLSGNAGTTQITINLSGSSGTVFGGNFYEIMPPAGSTASFDTAGTASQSSCQGPCRGVPLTLAGTDAVLEVLYANAPSAWNAWSSPFETTTNGDALYLNAPSGALSAPTATVRTPANGAVFTAIAFKSTLGSFTPPATAMSMVNAAWTNGGAISCNPTCSLTIPSTGTGHLLYLESATLDGTHITSVGGGGTWVVPSGCQIAIPSTGDTLSCAYVLSSTAGATSANITMSGSSAVTFALSEIASTGGPFTFDVQGSATNGASLSPGGVPLTLTGTNDVIFQSIFVPGGTSGATWYPLSNNWVFFNNNAAQVALLNASSGVRPFWVDEQNNTTVVTGVAFRTGTALAPAPPTGLAAVVH
jgi:hypothetical protein